MSTVKFDLVVRLDESAETLVFFTRNRAETIGESIQAKPEFSVEFSLEELRGRGASGAESVIGESVLGFFDHLTDGRLDLPKHYRDDSEA
jgi:hypothetical protein